MLEEPGPLHVEPPPDGEGELVADERSQGAGGDEEDEVRPVSEGDEGGQGDDERFGRQNREQAVDYAEDEEACERPVRGAHAHDPFFYRQEGFHSVLRFKRATNANKQCARPASAREPALGRPRCRRPKVTG